MTNQIKALRSWLKAEGFEFVDGQSYHLLQKIEPVVQEYFDHCYCQDNRKFYGEYWVDLKDVVAFKPIDDSPEAWDKLAGVEVYKEGK